MQRTYTYNPRYDMDDFVWAFDDYGTIIPHTAVWNLFSQTVITDIKDISYRQILSQYNLDGIVFLQPSIGLYQFNTYLYQSEVSYYGQSGYLQDFYISFGLLNTAQTYYFMGGEDIKFKYKLHNSNLLQNLTNLGLFDPTGYQPGMTYSDATVSRSDDNNGPIAVFVQQSLPQTQKSCFRVKFNSLSLQSQDWEQILILTVILDLLQLQIDMGFLILNSLVKESLVYLTGRQFIVMMLLLIKNPLHFIILMGILLKYNTILQIKLLYLKNIKQLQINHQVQSQIFDVYFS